jgi:glycosyltransferase involved in cell wall biosynthesis
MRKGSKNMSRTGSIVDRRVSIVIACYNQGHYLKAAIESALAPAGSEHEVLVVDDGSTDNTAYITRQYPQVIYIYQNNQGVANARNAGFAASSGDYVMFLDSDDMFLPVAIDAGLGCFRKHPECGFVFGRYQNVDENGVLISGPNRTPNEPDFYAALLQRNLIGMQSAVMYPRSVLEQCGGFNQDLRLCEDYDLYLRIARKLPVQKHDEVVAEYRKHGENSSRNYPLMLETVLRVLSAQTPHVQQNERYKSAMRAGISNWRQHYGNLMVREFRTHMGKYGVDRTALQLFKRLASCYPQGILDITRSTLRDLKSH